MRPASIISLLFLSIAYGGPALAGPREDSLAGISRCASLPDDRTFLDCVYGAVQPLRAELGLTPALAAQQRLVPPLDPSLSRIVQPPYAQSAPAPAPSRQASASNNSGFFDSLFSGSGLHMASYSFDRRGLFTVTLSDGSVWQQDSSDTNFAHFSGKASNYLVNLHPGSYGKTRLDVRGEPGPYLVDRIR